LRLHIPTLLAARKRTTRPSLSSSMYRQVFASVIKMPQSVLE
jgi:hypothetical protein